MNADKGLNAPMRFVPDLPLPPYTHVPGKTPHPFSDPLGHSHGVPRPKVAPIDPGDWQACRPYLFGVDLFNCGYYWESHETWESLWHGAGRRGMTADFLKALIHLAAAGVKHLEGNPRGVRSHAGRAVELWQKLGALPGLERGVFLGLALEELMQMAKGVSQTGWPEASLRLRLVRG